MDNPLRVGGVPEHFNLPFHLLQEAGSPVPFSWQDYPGGTGALCRALDASELDVATLLTEGAVAHNERHASLAVVSFWVYSPLLWGIHTGAASPIQTVAALRGKPFAISRQGSGSQLMCYFLAQQEGWPKTSLSFVEVGHLAGGTQALVHQEAAGFLWERFMTQPLVTDGSLRRLGVLPTPWPAFVLAVRPHVWEHRQQEVRVFIEAALAQAELFTKSETAAHTIAQRYGLTEPESAEWLSLTRWAYPLQEGVGRQLLKVRAMLDDVGAL